MTRSTRALSLPALLILLLCATPALAAGICDGISTASESPLTTVRIATGIVKPTWLTAPPGDTHRVFVLEQDGRVRIVKDGVLLATPFLDIDSITESSGDEQGLLGLAFSPNYATDGQFFVYHTDNGGMSNTLARYTRDSVDPDKANPGSRVVVLTIPHPTNTNHNGGCIVFGADDPYLWIGTGDGGGQCDVPAGNAQNTGEMKGKLLRIDVRTLPYTIPIDNPFRGPGNPLDEIWAYGLRNPWRYSFDRLTGDLYIGDVGQFAREEVDFRPNASTGGENYGWRNYEGDLCPPQFCATMCTPIATRTNPVKVYPHTGSACAVTGGYVYRGCRMPGLKAAGRYFYGDYCAAFINSFVMSGGVPTNEKDFTAELTPVGGFAINSITSFGEDARGEIYILDRGNPPAADGEIFKIVPTLAHLEVSGDNAQPLLLGATWTWENLAVTSGHPIDLYRVYRSIGNGSGLFTCIFKSPQPSWAGGDPSLPSPGGVFSYIVTAMRNSPLEETSPGTSSAGVPHSLSPAPCP